MSEQREQRDMSGVLFKNDRKEQEKHPDYKGRATVGGIEYWISAWIKVGQSGQKFMSLAFTENTGERRPPAPQKQQETAEDNCPF